jgi:hypothetical protein
VSSLFDVRCERELEVVVVVVVAEEEEEEEEDDDDDDGLFGTGTMTNSSPLDSHSKRYSCGPGLG